MSDNDIRIEIKFKNNFLLSAIEKKSVNVNTFCKKYGLHSGLIGRYVNLKETPVTMSKTSFLVATHQGGLYWKKTALEISSCLGNEPLEVFPETLWNKKKNNKFNIETSVENSMLFIEGFSGTKFLNAEEIENEQLTKDTISGVLSTITPREEEVINLRYGLKDICLTFEQIGKKFGVSTERVRQIEGKALRKLGSPTRANKFKDLRGY